MLFLIFSAVVTFGADDSNIFLVKLGDFKVFKAQGANVKIASAVQSLSIDHFEISYSIIRGKSFWTIKDLKAGKAWRLASQQDLLISAKDLRDESRMLPPKLKLHGTRVGLEVVAQVNETDYLVGVLSGEVPLSWPMEALKAQAVAARSYALSKLRERSKDRHHLQSTTMDQVFVYPDFKKEEKLYRALEAVKSTYSVVLVDPINHKPIKAFYHSDCGGKTQLSSVIFGAAKDYGAAQDSFCLSNRKTQWSFTLDQKKQKELSSKLGLNPQATLNFSQVNAGVLRISNSIGEVKELWIQKLREFLGFDQVRSPRFTITQKTQEIVFEGKGFGHGVGMCQWGARKMAEMGRSYEEILNHYYPKAKLRKPHFVISASVD